MHGSPHKFCFIHALVALLQQLIYSDIPKQHLASACNTGSQSSAGRMCIYVSQGRLAVTCRTYSGQLITPALQCTSCNCTAKSCDRCICIFHRSWDSLHPAAHRCQATEYEFGSYRPNPKVGHSFNTHPVLGTCCWPGPQVVV